MKQKRVGLIAIIVVVALLIGIVLVGWLDVFCLKSRAFAKQLTRNQFLVESFANYKDKLTKDGERDCTIDINGGVLSLLGASISNVSNINVSSNMIYQNDDFDIHYQLSTDGNLFQSGEIIRNNDLIAIAVPSLFQGYLAINQENAEEVAKKLELVDGEKREIDYISNGKKILRRYLNLIMKQLNDEITTHQETISINENDYYTKVYRLGITDRKLYNLLNLLSKKLIDDEEAISFVADCMVLSSRSSTEKHSKEEYVSLLKKALSEYLDSAKEEEFDFLDKDLIIVQLYVDKNQTLKTTIEFGENQDTMSACLETVEQYAFLKLQIKESAVSLRYTSSNIEDKYKGELSILSSLINIPILNIKIQEKASGQEVKRIDQLKARLINQMNDEELEALKNEMQNNMNRLGILGIDEIFQQGEFKIQDENRRISVLPKATNLYQKVTPGMKKEEVIAVLGEPDDTFTYDSYLYVSWFIEEAYQMEYPLVSVLIKENVVTTVYMDVYSSMNGNIQLSKELETDIDDLVERTSQVSKEATKEDVISILGNHYYEESKSDSGVVSLKWYDKNENSFTVEFDEHGNVTDVGMIEKGGI